MDTDPKVFELRGSTRLRRIYPRVPAGCRCGVVTAEICALAHLAEPSSNCVLRIGGMAERNYGLPDHVLGYLSCLLMHMGLPFLPLIVELMLTKQIDAKSLYLFAAIYPSAMAVTSYDQLQSNLAIWIGFVFAAAYGASVRSGPQIEHGAELAYAAVALFFLLHAVERFQRHIVDRRPFPEQRSRPTKSAGGKAVEDEQRG